MALLNFPNTRQNGSPLQNGDEYTGDNGVTYIYNNGKWVGHSPVLAAGTNSIINNGYVVQIDVNGNLILEPGKDIRDSDGNILAASTSTIGNWIFDSDTATTNGNIIVKAGPTTSSWASLLSNDGDNSFWVDNAGAHVTTDFSGAENYWTFGRDGTLKIPNSDTQITEQGIVNTTTIVALVSSGPTGAAALEWISDINEGTSTKIAIVTANSPFSATSGTVQVITGGLIFNGETTVPENVWDFDGNGNLTFPQGTLLGYSDPGGFIIDGAVDKDVAIYTYSGSDVPHGWTFGTDGTLTVSDDIQDANGSVIRVASTSTAPTRVDGQLWFNAEDGRAYIKYQDNWVDLNPPLVPPVSTYLDGLAIDGTTISTVDSAESMYIGGDLLPEYNNMYDLGSAERQWKSLYVSTSTIYIGGTPLSVDSAGNLLVDGSPIQAGGTALGDRLTSSTAVVSLDSNGVLTLPVGGKIAITSGMLIETDRGTLSLGTNMETPGVAGHFHIAFDESNIYSPDSDLFLGDDYNYVKLPGTLGQYDYGVEIGAHDRDGGNSYNWRFGTDGSMTFPDGSKQTTAYLGVDNNRWLDYMQANTEGYSYVLGVSSVQHDSQNNIVASVHHEAYGPNYTGIVKVDSAGSTVWERIYSTSTNVDGWGVAVDSNDDIYVAGHVGGAGVWLAKLDSDTGENIWQTGLDGFEGYVVDVGSDDCPVIVGADWYTNHDMFVAKFSSTGTILWQHELGDSVYNDDAWGMAVGPDNEIIVVGTTNHDGGSGSNVLLVAKYDVSGILQWQKEIYDSGWSGWNANGADAVVDPSGNIYVLFSQDSTLGASAILIKMSPDGETVDWNLTLSAECVDQYTAALDIDTDGNVYLNSTTIDTNGVNIVYNTFVSSVSSSGSIRWQRGLRRQITDQSTSSVTVVWPGAVIDTFGNSINGSSLSVRDGKIAIGGGSVNLADGDGPNPNINTALGYILQTTTDGDVFARGEWELFNTYFDVGSTTLTVNTGTLATDTRVMNVISIDVTSGPDPDNFLTIQRLREPVERIGTGASFEYSTLQEGLSVGPGAGGVTSITGNHDTNTGVGLTSENWAQLMWVPDTSVVTVDDISDGADVYNWAYVDSGGFEIKNAITGTDYTWTFDTDGVLNLPNNNYLETINSNLSIGSQGTATIRSNAETLEGTKSWIFDTDGSLTLPEGGVIKTSTGTNILDGLGGGAANIGNYTFNSDNLNMPLTAKLNSGGVGVANSAEFGTSVTVSTSTVVNSEIYMGSGYGEFRSIYNKVGEIESGLTYAGVEGFNYAQYGDVNFSGMVSQTPHIDSMYTISVSTTTGQISIGFTQDGGTSVSKDWITVLGTLNAYYTVNGIFADTTQTVIAGGDGVLSSIVKLTDSVNITTIDSISTITQTWTFGTDGVLRMPDGYYGDGRIAFNFEGYNWGNIRSHNRQVYIESGEGTTTTYSQIAVGQEISLSSIYDITLQTATTSTGDLYNDGTDHTPGFNNWIFGTDGNLTLPEGGTIKGGGTGTDVTVVAGTGTNNKIWTFAADGVLTFPDSSEQTTAFTGTVAYSNITGAPASVNKTSGSWTLATGANTVSITVAPGGNYQMWVNGNIPNGIVTWNATVSTSNTNVPVVGSQYGWYYAAGNALVLTSMPNQIVGTAGSISTATVATTSSNVFQFGITNNSTSTQVINWGYTTL